MKRALTMALVAAMAGGSVVAQAYEKGDFILRLGATTTDPNTDSDDISLPGVSTLEAEVNDDTQVGILPVYMVTENVGIELLLASPFEHDISLEGKGVDLTAASTKQLPPTLSVQWYPRAGDSGWQPYIGLGVNYTFFFNEETDSQLDGALSSILGATKTDLDLDNSFGLAVQAGVDIPFAEHWAITASVWYMDMDTDAKVKTDAGNLNFNVELNPLVYNVGIAYKF